MSEENQTNPRGVRTTEIWLCTVAALFSILWGAGVIDASPEATGSVNRAAALIGGALSALGYGVSRGLSKMNPKK